MNIPGIRLIVPLLCGLLLLAVAIINAKEPEKAKPSPTPSNNKATHGETRHEERNVNTSKSNTFRTANPKASPTPKPNAKKRISAADKG